MDDLRKTYLNPPELLTTVPEEVGGFPDRVLPIDGAAAAALKRRTMTGLYNAMPAWLNHAHHDIDQAVAAAYGWPGSLSDDEALARLLALNLERTPACFKNPAIEPAPPQSLP